VRHLCHAIKVRTKEGPLEIVHVKDALLRIRVEYIEMPDMTLTRVQARRLWNLSQEACDAALATLVRTGFLWRTDDGEFLRRSLGRKAAVRTRSDAEAGQGTPIDTRSAPDPREGIDGI
jgi:hypothetical protein